MPKPKERGGSKLGRTETATIRFDPRLRYLAELLARRQRRTFSSFVEWAMDYVLSESSLSLSPDAPSVRDEAGALWGVDKGDRLAKLAAKYPDLMTFDEQVVWKRSQQGEPSDT